jgi:hypothetical protein
MAGEGALGLRYGLSVAYDVAGGTDEHPANDACDRCGSMTHVLLTFCPGCGIQPLCPSCITAHVAELAELAGRSLGDSPA